jgi:hypothetical protein
MSLSDDEAFAVDEATLAPIESGTSILLTGEDERALRSVFYRLVAADEGEHAVVLATEDRGRSVARKLGQAKPGADDRATVLTAEGGAGSGIEPVEDLGDLTTLGMEFTRGVAEAQQESPRFRTGILLGSTLAGVADDTRSVYRFLNSSFLTDLRRGDGIGVCAIDTSADIGADMKSTISGLETSFKARVSVATESAGEATLDVSGLPGAEDSISLSL